ncbi:MAG: ribonuclease III [Candidatus Gracilibacteria bacterium]|nr:ribonuclease III [Candidatus Gracilibacteria bacterium]
MVVKKKAIHSEALMEKFEKLLNNLDIKFNDISHYILAFIHRSVVNEKPDYTPEHNERLEFLGDAVLELVITNNLFRDYPKKTEGELTDIRSALVRGTNLAKTAKNLNFADYLVLGKGEELTGGRKNDYLLANVVESIIGAIYIDLGIDVATIFINKNIYPYVNDIIENNLVKDYKTTIQEHAQAVFEITPNYIVLSESGLDHDKTFEVGVYLGDKMIGKGTGSSKKKAQEKAAQDGFNNIK